MEKVDQSQDQLKLQKTRSIHDAELLTNGAEYEQSEHGNIILTISENQREAAMLEMDKDLNMSETLSHGLKLKVVLEALYKAFKSDDKQKLNQHFSELIPLVCLGKKNIMNIPYRNMFRFISLWMEGKITPIVKTNKISFLDVLARGENENLLNLVEVFESISGPYSQCFEVEYQGSSHCINCIFEKKDRNYPHNNDLSQVERNLLKDLGLINKTSQ